MQLPGLPSLVLFAGMSDTFSSNSRATCRMQMTSPDPDALAFHSYASESVDLSYPHVTKEGLLTLLRSVRDISGDKRRKFLYSIPLEGPKLSIPPQELPPTVLLRLPSPSGRKTATLLQLNDKSLAFEIYQESDLIQRILLPFETEHGKVITGDPFLGDPNWNVEETKIVYAAERLQVPTSSFFEPNDDESIRGAQNTMGIGREQHWGERYADQAPYTDLFVLDLQQHPSTAANNSKRVVNKVPNVPPNMLLGQAIFTKDSKSIVYTAWKADSSTSRRLGLMYCQQRPCQLYLSQLGGDDAVLLTPHAALSNSPRWIQKTNEIVFLTSPRGFTTHAGCWALAVLDLTPGNSLGATRIVVDVVHDPVTAQRSDSIVCGLPFPGLYDIPLPVYSVIEPLLEEDDAVGALQSTFVWLTTQWGSCKKIVRVSLHDGEVSHVALNRDENGASETMLFADRKVGVVGMSSQANVGSIAIYHIPPENLPYVCNKEKSPGYQPKLVYRFGPMAVSSLGSGVDVVSNNPPPFDYEIISTKVDPIPGVEIDNPMQSILLFPRNCETPPPLIVVPHGGPHSVLPTSYLPGYAYLCGHGGYAILLVNYRGSTGFGQGLIEALPGRIGDVDVNDVIAAVDSVKGRVGPMMGVCGGSHGGFLAAHLSSRFAQRFQAAVLRNPVVNIPSMVTATDIPDWCYVEACDGTYDANCYQPPSLKQVQSMYEKSPTQYVHQVTAPTLVALGMKDLRVPPSQGLEWFYSLQSRGIPVKLQVYDNDVHAIDRPASEADHFVHIKKWFDSYLKPSEE